MSLKKWLNDNLFDAKFCINSKRISDDYAWIKKTNIDVYESLKILEKKFSVYSSELIYWIFHNIETHPVCYTCGRKTRFLNFKEGYRNFCSSVCSRKDKDVLEKSKKTNLERYGVEYPAQNNEIKNRTKETNIKKYGVEHPSKLSYNKKKREDTNLKKYGTKHIFNTSFFEEKRKNTNIEKYGVEYCLQNKDIRLKALQTHRRNNIDYFVSCLQAKEFTLLTDFSCLLENETFLVRCNNCSKEIELKGFRIDSISCECRRYSSNIEKEIQSWVRSLNIKIEENARFVISPYELDIYIPDHKLAIEFDGLFWHCEINKEKNYHLNKTLVCQEKGIQLIHIFENEWLYKQNIVKSIIKAKLGIFDERIFARKCTIKELSQQEYNVFLEENHLQGKSISKIRLGLFYNNELVSVMGFGKSRFKKDETELIRFANKVNTSIIGGFSKLLKYYIVNYKFDSLVSYCDLRYFDGSGYLKNGFEIVDRVSQNYYYWKKGTYLLYSRMQFQKHKLKDKLDFFDDKLSEAKNMFKNGYFRIYDCGNLKLRLINA